MFLGALPLSYIRDQWPGRKDSNLRPPSFHEITLILSARESVGCDPVAHELSNWYQLVAN